MRSHLLIDLLEQLADVAQNCIIVLSNSVIKTKSSVIDRKSEVLFTVWCSGNLRFLDSALNASI